MTKRKKGQGEKSAPRLKAAFFDFTENQEIDKRIAIEGVKPFSIRFRTPDGDAKMGMAARAATAAEGGQAGGDAEGALIREFCVRQLVSWTLPHAVGDDSFRALAKGCRAAAIAIFNAIAGAGEDSKN